MKLLAALCLSILALAFRDHPDFYAWLMMVVIFAIPAYWLWVMVWVEKDQFKE